MDVFDLIVECARIPSFSSYEDRLHPFIEDVARQAPNVRLERVTDNNLIIEAASGRKVRAVALAAHLDKINHFGQSPPGALPARREEREIIGQLDDAVGIGVCLQLLLESREDEFSPFYVLLSEMEESFGLRRHPHLLRQGGKGLFPRIGAARITEHLLKSQRIPAAVIVIDTTPLFGGREGVALYSRHWEINGRSASSELIERTDQLARYFTALNPALKPYNNVNDYVMYGDLFNRDHVVPCLALEPAIFPYHEIGERVFCGDVATVTNMLRSFLREGISN